MLRKQRSRMYMMRYVCCCCCCCSNCRARVRWHRGERRLVLVGEDGCRCQLCALMLGQHHALALYELLCHFSAEISLHTIGEQCEDSTPFVFAHDGVIVATTD